MSCARTRGILQLLLQPVYLTTSPLRICATLPPLRHGWSPEIPSCFSSSPSRAPGSPGRKVWMRATQGVHDRWCPISRSKQGPEKTIAGLASCRERLKRRS